LHADLAFVALRLGCWEKNCKSTQLVDQVMFTGKVFKVQRSHSHGIRY